MSGTFDLKTQRLNPFESRIPFQNKPLSPIPSPHNPINKHRISERCPFCTSRQTFNSHWKYHYHITFHHGNESRGRTFSLELGSKIIRELSRWPFNAVKVFTSFWLHMILELMNLNGKFVKNISKKMHCSKKISRRKRRLKIEISNSKKILLFLCWVHVHWSYLPM